MAVTAGNPIDALVVGLGNPGTKYENTRHNVGAATVALLASRWNAPLKPGRDHALVGAGRVEGRRVVVAVPTTYMNESGRALSALLRRYTVEDWDHVVVVHDELDLPEGKVKVKRGGGLAGNNGLRSIVAHLHTPDFVRVRLGIGKPPGGKDHGARHVLRPMTGTTRETMAVAVGVAADAVTCIVTEGVDAAMRRHNGAG